VVIIAGPVFTGAAMGYWRSPFKAGYNLAKFPFLLLATALGNALLNGMIAPLLGLNLPFRQSFLLVLMSFTIAATILGSHSPRSSSSLFGTHPPCPDMRASPRPPTPLSCSLRWR